MGRLVYFLRPVGEIGPIKIGSSHAPADRIKWFARWSPIPLEIVGSVPGTMKDERFLHRCFADNHLHHEWFRWSDALQRAMLIIIAADSVEAARQFLVPMVDVSPCSPRWGRRKMAAAEQTNRAGE